MSHPDQSSKLPLWLFLITDAVLLVAAWYIAEYSPRPMSGNTAFAIVGCIVAGAIVVLVPVVARYERQKNETLDQRQRELEALGRTISTSAEQISIAANGFNEITELAHKNLKQAELLPHRLQEKVAEFNAQLDNAREDDREELEKELAELRASETERLEIIAEKVHKAVIELSKLDMIAQQHVTEGTDRVERANDALSKAHSRTVQTLNDAIATASRQLAEAQSKSLAAIDAKLAERTAAAVAAITSAVVNAKDIVSAATPHQVTQTASSFQPTPAADVHELHASPAVGSAAALDITSVPKRPRKIRREESDTPPALSSVRDAQTTASTSEIPLPPPELVIPAATPTTSPSDMPAVSEVAAQMPQTSQSPEVPVQPAAQSDESTRSSIESSTAELAPSTPALDKPAATPASDVDGPEQIERPARKRSAKKTPPEPAPDLTLELSTEEFSSPTYDDGGASNSDASERVISSDGATRLIATAYIGIGNRLFVRGSGPGLSWEKGVPLQFVSIGKWRWETAETAAPVTVKLYKNDETECSALGAITLDPGHQHEVTARF